MRSVTKTTRVMTAPTSTTNITGFFAMRRGSSFQNESTMALRKILRSPKEVAFAGVLRVMDSSKIRDGRRGGQKAFPAFINKCSRIGPRLRAGKKVRAPTITTTEINKEVKSGPLTGNVPSDSGTCFFAARLPAMARTGMTEKKRPRSMATAVVTLNQREFALMPANAEPLLPAEEV